MPLSPEQALQLALLQRPGLFIRPDSVPQAQIQILAEVRTLSYRINRAWIDAVAARQTVGTLREVHGATRTAAELARRMTQAGNWSKVPLLQAQIIESGAATQLAQAQLQEYSAREKLLSLMGLWSAQALIELPLQLHKLPDAPLPWGDGEAQALQQHQALASANFDAQIAQSKVNPQDVSELTQAMREAAMLTIPGGTDAASKAFAPVMNAPRLPRMRAVQMDALEAAAAAQSYANALAATTRSQARQAWFRYRSAWDMARHQRDVVLPLSTALQEETQLRYNGMLQSTWELLASARARLDSVNAAVQAQRDFWLAHVDLQAVLSGGEADFSTVPSPSSATNILQKH